ncbi:hypothetical protein M0R45_027519 [Rubus argutus]|uniref:Uncharacterized protein n=1 Tax=Rubus argutus TaxID=59490 RepID=A0AAW1X437_RUBAR
MASQLLVSLFLMVSLFQVSLGSSRLFQISDEKYSLGKSLTNKQIVKLASLGDQKNAINVVLTSADVSVDGFCMNRCGTHGAAPGSSQIRGKNYKAHPLVAPNNDVGLDGMVINLASLLAGNRNQPFRKWVLPGSGRGSIGGCFGLSRGLIAKGAYPGYAGDLLVDATTGASYNANGANGRKYLVPALFDPSTSTCSTLV